MDSGDLLVDVAGTAMDADGGWKGYCFPSRFIRYALVLAGVLVAVVWTVWYGTIGWMDAGPSAWVDARGEGLDVFLNIKGFQNINIIY